ncbi:MAG: hypothetical protein PVH84_09335 [Candidatus Aminicenantes bacterium]
MKKLEYYRTVTLFLLIFIAFFSAIVQAQEQPIPEQGEWIKSMGFPQKWKPHIGALFDWNTSGGSTFGGEFHLGIYRDILNPISGVFGLTGEGYIKAAGGKTDGGLRLLGTINILHLHAGIDYSFEKDKGYFMLSILIPGKRGGPFGRGGRVRIDWLPKAGPTFRLGLEIPIGQKYMGKTRPRMDHVRLPEATEAEDVIYKPIPELEESLQKIRLSADWINRFTTPFFDQERKTDEKHLTFFREKLTEFKTHIHQTNEDFPNGRSYEAEINFYHKELENAFKLASGFEHATREDSPGLQIAKQAKKILLDEVILPYNRLLGEWKKNDSLLGLGSKAYLNFSKWVDENPDIFPKYHPAVKHVFHQLIEYMEENRQGSRKYWEDTRLVWIPMHYALKFEDHDTQEELNAILEKAVEEKFTPGNDVYYVVGGQFQYELARMILEAKDYHILWIHDYKGIDSIGEPDEIAYRITREAYLRALTNAVKNFKTTQKIPVYMILLDQHYYEINKSELWLKLLENPLEYKIDLPSGYEGWERDMADTQEELREAVASSPLLQAGLSRYGKKWLLNKIKVHINITNPPDFSFTSSHIFRYVPFIPDNVMRDHRKITFFDITEFDPGKGEAMYTGVGVGEHYATPTWDDRAILARGPSLIALKDSTRELLLTNGFKETEIPYPLRPLPKPDNYKEMVNALVEKGWDATSLQAHNFTGFGPKPANLVKAILYNLMPKGSHMYIPDSLWNSPLWAGMLVGAAMRGCKVFVIAPSLNNAPSAGTPQMSRANEIFTRFIVIQNDMREEIEAAGGMFKAGVYNLDIDVFDMVGRGKALVEGIGKIDWYEKVFPFDAAAIEEFKGLVEHLESQGFEPSYLAQDEEKRMPKLHFKAQFFASFQALSSLLEVPGWGQLIREYILVRAKALEREGYVSVKELRAELSEEIRAIVEKWYDSLTPEQHKNMIFYLTVGSHNQDYRSKIQDGEVTYVISHLASMIAYLDFIGLMGRTTWVESIEEMEELLPRFSGFWYKIGRYIKNAL